MKPSTEYRQKPRWHRPSTLRLLLTSHPLEFDPEPPEGTPEGTESDREFMIRQAKRAINVNDGAGLSYASAEEHARLIAVWLNDEDAPPIRYFSASLYGVMRHDEEKMGGLPTVVE